MANFGLAKKLVMGSVLVITTTTIPLVSKAVLTPGESQENHQSTVQLLAYENACESEELKADDTVIVNGDEYTLEEDENGLFISYIVVDENNQEIEGQDGTLSVVNFGADCSTVQFEEVGGVDTVGEDQD
jgi:hypothetical protein